MLHGEPVSAEPITDDELKTRIIRFMSSASTEITPLDAKRLPDLVSWLPAGTSVYVAHTSASTVGDVVGAALAVRYAGFTATPHIVARRIPNALALRTALTKLRAGGVEQILLVAGDAAQPNGEFGSTLDILESGILEQSGMMRIGVAAHPEGHKAVGPTLLWDALQAKQAFADFNGIRMHVVSQFSFNSSAIETWLRELGRYGIHLPVHVGIAGPAPLSKLIRYAMQCGIGLSLRTVLRNLSAVGTVAELAISPDQHLLRLLATPLAAQIVAPHFFAFGGCVETAHWIHQIAAGTFEIDSKASKLRLSA
jgi:methylenetetrahydrofolate reductase (NADPH)